MMLDREEASMPTTQRDNDPQSSFLSAIRESQAAVIDVIRVWSDIGQQLTRDLRLPIARIDLTDAVDRAFDVAEQTLAVQRQLALTLTGLASRQLETTVDTVAETVDTTVEAADSAVETVQGTVRERARQVEAELKGSPERVEQPQGDQDDTPTAKAESPRQDRRPEGAAEVTPAQTAGPSGPAPRVARGSGRLRVPAHEDTQRQELGMTMSL